LFYICKEFSAGIVWPFGNKCVPLLPILGRTRFADLLFNHYLKHQLMRKNGDFVFLRPVLRLGIGMMAALCERTISFTFDESGSAPADNTGDSNSSAGGDTTPNATSDTALRAVATVTIAKE
jgi:hypothetical protein